MPQLSGGPGAEGAHHAGGQGAAGGEGQVSSYVATALADYQEREGLEEVLAAWRSETPIADDVRRQVLAELDAVGLAKSSTRSSRQAG